MPLVRFQVRNHYGLGQPKANRENPKAVLDGVAVAGLVGVLRQLGDLAEFAGEVFHDLQEQVTMTASRSHSLKVRVQNIEAALTPVEKAIQAQTSHIHFAYTAGLEWYPRIRNEQNHFIYGDLPQFIMDSYEECRDPPRLHLLDRFDTGGPGSCIKRYSDPTLFRRVSTSFNEKNAEKTRRDKKARKMKKKRSSSLRNGEFSRGTSIYGCRMQFDSSIGNGQASPSQTVSTIDRTLKSDHGEHSNSFDSRTGSGYVECVFPRGSSMLSEEQSSKKASPRSLLHNDNIDLIFSDEHRRVADNNYLHDSFEEKITPGSSCISWEEKGEVVEPKGQQYVGEEDDDILLEKSEINMPNIVAVNLRNVDQMDTVFANENAPASTSDRSELDDIESETDNYMDARNVIESESEHDLHLKVESIISNALPSGSSDHNLHDQPGKKVVTSFSGSQEISAECVGSESVKLWTNGNLLGLQPSKPPDFAAPINVRELSLSRSLKETVGSPNHTFTIKDGEDKGKGCMLRENDRSIQKSLSSKNLALFPNDRKACTPTERTYGAFSQASLNLKGKESDDFVNGNRSSQDSESGRIEPSLVSAGSELSVAYGDAASVEPPENNEKSLLMFGLGHRLLVNGISRNSSLVPDHKCLSSNSLARIPETAFREQFERELPQDSPASSPPLEHMKISFLPLHGFETSKLKLKFPGRSAEEMFPSFQLVPDSAISLHDTYSGSDDDTFCRSSPYMSDGCNSIQSDLNFEDWEVSEDTGSNNQERYGTFCRVPGSESVSSSPDLWEAANNGDGNHLNIEKRIEHSVSGPLVEPPSLDVVNPYIHQETKGDSDPTQPDPLPPPLPPVKWRLLKSHPEMEEPFSELGKSPISQQAQSDREVKLLTNEDAVGSQQNSEINEQKEANLISNCNEILEKRDFLQQIRTQSFNLRRITPAKPAIAASNVSVTTNPAGITQVSSSFIFPMSSLSQ